MKFGDFCRKSGVLTVAMFGDSITAGFNASVPDRAWTALFAAETGTMPIDRAIPGSVMQAAPDAF